jgi:predicted O-methyltransferase YrrM
MVVSPGLVQRRAEVASEIRRLAPDIGKVTEDVLADMYSAKQLNGIASDKPINIDDGTRISIAQGAQINQLVRQSEITKTLEIGFAYGFSTIWILDALQSRGRSSHVSIDPFETTEFGGIGLYQVKRLSVATTFEWICEYSIHALARLIKTNKKYDFIFIEGNHRFDDVLVDFYLSDQLVSPGGFLAFDDMWMPSVQTVVSFVLKNRQYKVVAQPVRNVMVLQKIADDDRHWAHYEKFEVSDPEREQSVSGLRQMVLQCARITGTEQMLRRIWASLPGPRP